jgi:hypothetical protein
MKTLLAAVLLACAAWAGATGAAAQQKDACGKPMTTAMKAQRAADILEIQNVASAHEYYHSAVLHQEEIDNIWSKREDVAWKNNVKYYSDRKSFMQFYAVDIKHVNLVGLLWFHMLTTPVIEVAGDGQTAKAVWLSFGNVTDEAMGAEKGNIPQWAEEKYAMDFIKEEGCWKIWRLRTYVEFNSPFDKSWTELNFKAPADASNAWPPETASNRATTGAGAAQPYQTGQYYIGYDPKRQKPAYEPAPPAPYCSWKDVKSYTEE